MVDEPEHAAEVFSLMRDSDLATDAYLDRFFDTGDERQGRSTGGAAYDPSTWSAA
jgi:hypothetical protein